MIKNLTIGLLLCSVFLEGKLPQITPRDAQVKIEEILRVHASHKRLTPELIGRVLQNFLEELDPTKTYFVESEIAPWINASESLLQEVLQKVNGGDFSHFSQIHSILVAAVERRNALEKAIQELPTDVNAEELRDLEWATTQDELFDRLKKIRSLQRQAFSRLDGEPMERMEGRILKRRLNHEAEWIGAVPEERTKLVLTLALKSITAALDSHTNYFTPTEANQFMIQVQQRLFGIGAQLRDDLDGLSVVRIVDNSPASQGNLLKINDKILAVNQEPVVGLDIVEAVELIRGEEGTPVVLTVVRESKEGIEKFDVELIRGEIVLEESRFETHIEPFADGVIVHVRLFSFYQDQNSSSALDIRKVLDEACKEHQVKGVLFDLRGNAGGLLSQAVSVTGLFIHNGIVVSVKDHLGRLQHLREVEGNPAWEGPLVVLVNRASASAAEIVAQTLQDYGRAIIVGDDHTYGKGTFQTFTLDAVEHPIVNPQGEYKVTRGRYYTVSGKSPQLTGVISDIEVPGILSKLDVGEEFSKFPLENDVIEAHFSDDLSDLSPFYRIRLGATYKADLQPRLTTYAPYLPMLQKNAKGRITGNPQYQEFLKSIENKEYDTPAVDLFGQGDLQGVEATNVLKDLIFLLQLYTVR